MKIGLHDSDFTKFPNLALMKLSAWHKSQGDDVGFFDTLFGGYDKIYSSKIFTFTPACKYLPEGAIKGGTGYPCSIETLPDAVEHICPDYDLYARFVGDAVRLLRWHNVTPRAYFCYVLVKDIEDAIERVKFLKGINVDPFAQPYRDFNDNKKP